ncbi:hypothetical protein NKR23_g3414 [Pleurostoma richardsiae]|uniref:Uncharacterized protein n=1 Tax=Pleurostoma richardsiae TaxID=41990 RepID=A0AA38RM27_9PEZI|nr:hypothetical protein NKR23_g3414 [Pleurostoma richardsiae]
MSLQRLPAEILEIICQGLCVHCRRKGWASSSSQDATHGELTRQRSNLSKLSRTCKVFRAIGQPILFHTFCEVQKNCKWDKSKMIPFARTIVERPDLATCVTDFCILHHGTSGLMLTIAEKAMFNEATKNDLLLRGIMGLPRAMVDGQKSSYVFSNQNDPEQGRVLALMIILRLPNLQRLVYMPPRPPNTTRAYRRADYAWDVPESNALASLKKITIGRYNTMNAAHVDGIFANAPSLESLTIQEGLLRLELIPFENLSELNISSSRFNLTQLHEVVNRCHHLESFKLTPRAEWKDVRPNVFLRHIEPLAGRLKHLQIDFGMKRGHIPATGLISTFKLFTSLETLKLECDAVYFGGTSATAASATFFTTLLPPSMKKFYLIKTHQGLKDAIASFAPQAKMHCPALELVYFGHHKHRTGLTLEEIVSFEKPFESVGVRLQVVGRPKPVPWKLSKEPLPEDS